jgi:hypothetical protein
MGLWRTFQQWRTQRKWKAITRLEAMSLLIARDQAELPFQRRRESARTS